MTKLVIKGHLTRGKEVIEILEMLGGNNTYNLAGDCDRLGCFIGIETRNIYNDYLRNFDSKDVIIFTIEEFLEKFPHKVGDKVQHKGATSCGSVYEVEKMRWVGNHVEYTIKRLWHWNDHLTITTEDLQPYKETMEERKYADLRLDVDQDDKLATEATIDGDKITSPENYLIGKITKVDNGMLVEFVKKRPQFPKTYEECCKVLFPNSIAMGKVLTSGYNCELLKKFGELLICRDSYWKIAGEQMGLNEPWKPNWLDTEQDKFVLYTHNDVICSNRFVLGHNVLAFPTEEMRDMFYENFKELIEQCKELL